MKNTPTVTLMCGLPRSGKSTWIRKNKIDEIVISPDEVRAKIFGHQFFANAEGFVWAFAESMVKLLLEQDKSVIIDATNITSASRYKWIKIAESYKAKVKIVFFKTSLKVCLRRNEKSKAGQKLPEKVINNMAIWFEDPIYSEEEGFEILHVTGKKTSVKKYNSKECFIRNNYVGEVLKDGSKK